MKTHETPPPMDDPPEPIEPPGLLEPLLGPYGPRTDVRYMTRDELFGSARSFLGFGLVCLGLWGVVGWGVDAFGATRQLWVLMLLFGLGIATGCGFVGALYLGIRGALRSPTFDPAVRWAEDMERRLALGEPQRRFEGEEPDGAGR